MNKQFQLPSLEIKAIIGLGNPGPHYCKTRHNIGFQIVDLLASQYQGHWQTKNNMEFCSVVVNDKKVFLVKPLTFMNNSGQVLASLTKLGIKQENILVVHDELELPFGVTKLKFDGSAKGHNGLKSIITHGGAHFLRLRFGIDRPISRDDVPDYVLAKFREPQDQVDEQVQQAVDLTIDYLSQ